MSLDLDEFLFDRGLAEGAVHGSIEAGIAFNECGRVWLGWEPFAERNCDGGTASDTGMAVEGEFRHGIAVSEDEIEQGVGVLQTEWADVPIGLVIDVIQEIPGGEVIGGRKRAQWGDRGAARLGCRNEDFARLRTIAFLNTEFHLNVDGDGRKRTGDTGFGLGVRVEELCELG